MWNYHQGSPSSYWQCVFMTHTAADNRSHLSIKVPPAHTPPPARPHPCGQSCSRRAALCPHNVCLCAAHTMSVNDFLLLIWSTQHYLFEVFFKARAVLWDECQCNDESQRRFNAHVSSLYWGSWHRLWSAHLCPFQLSELFCFYLLANFHFQNNDLFFIIFLLALSSYWIKYNCSMSAYNIFFIGIIIFYCILTIFIRSTFRENW